MIQSKMLLSNLLWTLVKIFVFVPIVIAESLGINAKLSHQQIASDQAFRVTLISSNKSILRAALSVRSEPDGGSKSFVVWSQAPPLERNIPYVFDVRPPSQGFPSGMLKGVIRYRGRIEELFSVNVKITSSEADTSEREHPHKLSDTELVGRTNVAQKAYRVEASGGSGADRAVDGVYDFSSSVKLPLGTPLVVKFIKPFLVDAVRISLGGEAEKQTAFFVEGSLDGQNWSTLVHEKKGIPPGRYAYRSEPESLRFVRITAIAQSTSAVLDVVEFEAFTKEAFPELHQNVALAVHGGQIKGDDKQLKSLIDGKLSSWSSDSKQSQVTLSFYQNRMLSIGAVLLLPSRNSAGAMPETVELWSAPAKDGALILHSKHMLGGLAEAKVITFEPADMAQLELHFFARDENRISLGEIEVHEVTRSGAPAELEQFVFQPLPRGIAPQTEQNTLDDLAGARIITPQVEGETSRQWLLQLENRTPWRIKQDSEAFSASFFANQKRCGKRLLLRTSGGPAEVEISTRQSAEGPVELVSKALLPEGTVIPYQWFGLKLEKLCGHVVELRFNPLNNSSLNIYQVALMREPVAHSNQEEAALGLNIASAGLGGSVRLNNVKSRKRWPSSALIDGMISNETGNLTRSLGWSSVETSEPVELEFEFLDAKTADISGFGIHTGVKLGTGILSEAIRRNSLRSIPAEFEVFAWNGSEWHQLGATYFLRSAGGLQRYFFEHAERASKLKLRLLKSYGKPFYRLGEVEIYESLETDSILKGKRLNLLDRRLGASLVSYPFSGKRPNTSPGRVLAGGRGEDLDAKSWVAGGIDLPQSFVFSFRNQQIVELDEVQLLPVEKPYRMLAPQRVQIWATDSLVPLRNERLISEARWEDANSTLFLPFPEPLKVRYLHLRILEAHQTPSALGIVSAFGRFLSHGAETNADSGAASRVPLKGIAETEPNNDTQQAQIIVLNTAVVGTLSGYEDRDVFRFELPESDTKRFHIRLTGEPRLLASLEVKNEQQEPLVTFDPNGTRRTYQESLSLSPGVYYYDVFRRPRRTALVVDNSQSMNASLELLKQAVNGYLERQEPDEKIALVTFSQLVHVLQKFTSHGLAVQRAVNVQFRASGGTALYDGITTAARLFEKEPVGERVIILLTDGADTASTDSGPADLWKQLIASGINMFVIGLGRDLSVFQERTGVRSRALLETIASSTAGRFFQADGAGDLAEIFDKIDEIIRRAPKYQLEIAQSTGSAHLKVDGTEVQFKQELANTEVALLLDVSGSMAAKGKDGKRRIDISREVINDLVGKLPQGSVLSLRAYGHRVSKANKKESCKDTELIIPPQLVDAKQIKTVLRRLRPKGHTPIGSSLRALAGDFRDNAEEKLVVLLTDGEETCSPEPSDPDYPPRVLEELRQAGFRISLNIVGLNIDKTAAEISLQLLAEAGGGSYFPAKNKTELGQALSEAFAVKFSVRDGLDEEVAKGRIGGEDIELAVGNYTVVLSSKPEFVIQNVSIEPNKLTLVKIARVNETLRSTMVLVPR